MKFRYNMFLFFVSLTFSLVVCAQERIEEYESDFVPFKDYPNVQNPKIHQVKVTDEMNNWDLGFLYSGPNDPNIIKDIDAAAAEAKTFKAKYEQNLSMELLKAKDVIKAIKEYEKILGAAIRVQEYVFNISSVDLNNAELIALAGKIDKNVAGIATDLSFFENTLTKISESYKRSIQSVDTDGVYGNWIAKLTGAKKYLLSQKEEELLMDKNVNGVSALVKLRQQFVAKFSFMFKGPNDKEPVKHTLSDLVVFLEDDSRDIRQGAMNMFLEKFKEWSFFFTNVYNAVIGDMLQIEKKHRGFDKMISVRNITSQLDDNVVRTMHEVTVENYKLAQRYWRLKAKILGINGFNNADVKAPYVPKGLIEKKYTFTQALALIDKVDRAFYPAYADAFENMYRCGLISAKPGEGKRDGAYCDSFGVGYPPVVLTSFNGTVNDVSTVAHEGGHWVHFLLMSQNQPLSNANPPTALAETASIFNEMLLGSKLLEEAKGNKKEELALLVSTMDGIVASVFRQTAFSMFEQASFDAVDKNGPQTPEQFADIFKTEYGKLFGDAVQMTPNFKYEWERIPHFMTPFYVYAYAFGQLATIALYQNYLDHKDTFPAKYMQFLALGSSKTPVELFKAMDIDLADRATWEGGFKYISSLVDRIEVLSKDI